MSKSRLSVALSDPFDQWLIQEVKGLGLNVCIMFIEGGGKSDE